MKKRLLMSLLCVNLLPIGVLAQLNGLSFCIDPGHGGHNPANDRRIEPDPGIVFWESEGNFQKALLLDTLLQAKGATVILTRYTNDYPNDADEPTLSQRVAIANANNVNWFHSIHSNAFNGITNYTLLLVRESTVTPGQPESPSAFTMASLMSPRIQAKLRTSSNFTRLDFSFLGFRLGVLNGLIMPGELSEGSFHDVFPETRRLLNNHYRKMEAYALRDAILQNYLAPADPLGIIAGIQTEIGLNRPMNGTLVRLLPIDRVYDGDMFNNGFYMFDNLPAGSYTVRFETIGFGLDSTIVNLLVGGTVFADKQLESLLPPTVVSSIPAQGDTLFSADRSITIQFTKSMNITSVVNAFSLTPSYSGAFQWSNNNSTMVFNPDSILPFFVNFTLKIDSTAQSLGGQQLDGDGNGVPGDSYVLNFRTRDVDAFPPIITSSYPGPADTLRTPTHVLNVTFDEPLNPATVTLTNVSVQKIGGSVQPRDVQYWESGIRSGVNIYLQTPLEAGASYRVRVSGVSDVVGNIIPNSAPVIWQFEVAPPALQYAAIDLFDSSLASWAQPGASGSTVGIDSASFLLTTGKVLPPATANPSAAELAFDWNTNASDWLLREYLALGPPRDVLWTKDGAILQTYIWGDGSGTQFRFAVDDSVEIFPGGNASNHEVSTWRTIDWVGWRLVDWDMERDSIGAWLGNGLLEGTLRFDSFQLRFQPGVSAGAGQIVFDQLQIGKRIPTGVEDNPVSRPKTFSLHQNYPNPFNPSTLIGFSVPQEGYVTLRIYDVLGREVATLVDETKPEGNYRVEWDGLGAAGGRLGSGVYVYRLEVQPVNAGMFYHASRKMVLLK